ncbi:MAG: hypothetical protein MJ252_30865 [archaeon]|nr:hypothetical protein [archaeon]
MKKTANTKSNSNITNKGKADDIKSSTKNKKGTKEAMDRPGNVSKAELALQKEKEEQEKAKQEEEKKKKLEGDYKRLTEYLNESGLNLAFNIIFAELITKQINQENFFPYTAMRLKEIGKELEGIKDKEITVDNLDANAEEGEEEEGAEEEEENNEDDNVFMTAAHKKKK